MKHNDILISPSILSCDLMHLADEVATIATDADLIHVDVMDGEFVPNLTFGLDIVRGLKREFDLPLDVHLMIERPDERALAYAEAGADLVVFHFEASKHPHRLVKEIQARGAKAGIALNPGTPVWQLESLLNVIDMALVMSVEPGFSGQEFIEYSYGKVKQLRSMADELGKRTRIEVDGGVSLANAERLAAAGADVLVAGSSVFNAPDRAAAVRSLRDAGRRGVLGNL